MDDKRVRDVGGFREEYDGDTLTLTLHGPAGDRGGPLRVRLEYDADNSPLSGTRDNYVATVEVGGARVFALNSLGGPRLTGFAGDSLYGLRRMAEPALAFAADPDALAAPPAAAHADRIRTARDAAAEYDHAIHIEHELGLDLDRPERDAFPGRAERSAFDER